MSALRRQPRGSVARKRVWWEILPPRRFGLAASGRPVGRWWSSVVWTTVRSLILKKKSRRVSKLLAAQRRRRRNPRHTPADRFVYSIEFAIPSVNWKISARTTKILLEWLVDQDVLRGGLGTQRRSARTRRTWRNVLVLSAVWDCVRRAWGWTIKLDCQHISRPMIDRKGTRRTGRGIGLKSPSLQLNRGIPCSLADPQDGSLH